MTMSPKYDEIESTPDEIVHATIDMLGQLAARESIEDDDTALAQLDAITNQVEAISGAYELLATWYLRLHALARHYVGWSDEEIAIEIYGDAIVDELLDGRFVSTTAKSLKIEIETSPVDDIEHGLRVINALASHILPSDFDSRLFATKTIDIDAVQSFEMTVDMGDVEDDDPPCDNVESMRDRVL